MSDSRLGATHLVRYQLIHDSSSENRNLQIQCSQNAKIGCFQFRAKNGINYNMFCTPKHTHKEAVVDTKNEKNIGSVEF